MTAWVGSSSGNKVLLDPKVGSTGGTRRDVQVIYVGTASGNKLVYQRIPTMTLTATAAGWDQINLSWPNAGAGITYELLRSGSLVYSGTGTTYSDIARMPSTTYSYTLRTLSGSNVLATSTASRVTPAHGAIVLTATPTSWQSMSLSWTDGDQRSITNYKLYRWTGAWSLIDDGADKVHAESGLAEGITYYYLVEAYRGSTYIPEASNQAVATTPVRTTSTGTIFGPGTSSYSWTECTEKTLVSSTNAAMTVTGYVYSFSLTVRGYGDSGRVNPQLDAEYLGFRACDSSSTSYPSLSWTVVPVSNKLWGPGGHQVGAKVGGDCNKTQWYASTSSYNTNISWGQVDYWYYTSLERDAELREQPWWRDELAGRDLHIESRCNAGGDTVEVKVYDKKARSVLVEWAKGA